MNDIPRTKFGPLPEQLSRISGIIVDSALTVHKYYGPGLKESIYEESLILELKKRGVHVESQVMLPVQYYEQTLKQRLKLDLLVEKSIIVEIKSAQEIITVHEVQLITYLKITGLRLGLIINFDTSLIKNSIKRIIR
jgi:GxxExxY protein